MIKYKNGDWFAIPLVTSGYAIGRLAGIDKHGILLGYFFGTKYNQLPSGGELESLMPKDSVYIARFSYVGLKDGKWPLLSATAFKESDWPVPIFARHQNPAIGGRIFKVFYSENNLVTEDRSIESDQDKTKDLPKDGLAGAAL